MQALPLIKGDEIYNHEETLYSRNISFTEKCMQKPFQMNSAAKWSSEWACK